jgi:hypothetical protein
MASVLGGGFVLRRWRSHRNVPGHSA